MGNPRVKLNLQAKEGHFLEGHVVARLNALDASGRSYRLSMGVCNLDAELSKMLDTSETKVRVVGWLPWGRAGCGEWRQGLCWVGLRVGRVGSGVVVGGGRFERILMGRVGVAQEGGRGLVVVRSEEDRGKDGFRRVLGRVGWGC